jgi:outer membrane protein insertion porin family
LFKKNILTSLAVILFVLISSFAFADDIIKSVVIKGNHRVDANTIKSYMLISDGQRYNKDLADESLKRIYATDLFSDVSIEKSNSTLVVNVTENPTINKVFFEGNKKIKDKELQSELALKSRMVYNKSKLQGDINRVIQVYNNNGRYAVKVSPKIVQLPQNRIDLIFEIDEGPKSKIEKIIFIGNNYYSDAKLQSIISSQEARWYNFLTSDDIFNPGRVEFDKELLTKFYKSQGYADFEVISAISDLSIKKDRFIVTYTIREGKKYNFGKISIDNKLSGRKKIDFSGDIVTAEGKLFNQGLIDKTIDNVTAKLNDIGYPFVQIIIQDDLDKEKAIANITYVIQEGAKLYLNKINITGNSRTADKVIRREFRIAEGDPYDASKIKRSEQKIKNLDYFENVDMKISQSDKDDKFDVDLSVSEKSTASIKFAGGYSTREGPLASIGIKETNLFGNGQEIDFDVMRAKNSFNVDMGFTEPYFMDRNLSAGFDVYNLSDFKDDSQNRVYSQTRRGISPRIGYYITEHLSHSLSYNFQNINISNVDSNASILIQEQAGLRRKSSIAQQFVYDKRDADINPTDGYLFSLKQEYAGIGGNTNFIKHDIRARYYRPIIGDDIILRIYGDAGYMFGTSGKPVRIDDRYFIGGDDLRGFDYSGIGPRPQNTQLFAQDSLGGNIYYTGSAEINFPIGTKKDLGLGGILFVDAGDLYKVDNLQSIQQTQIFNQSYIRLSVGMGIKVSTPIGPVVFNYGVPIRKQPYDRLRRFLISFTTKM